MELLDKRKQTFEFFKFLHIVPYDSPQIIPNFFLCAQSLSCVWFFAAPKIVAHQAPSVMGFSRQEYCTGQPFPSPRDLPGPGIKSPSLTSPALAGGFFMTGQSGKTFPPYIPPHSPASEKKKKFTEVNSHILKCTCFNYTIKRFLSKLTVVQLSPQSSFRIFPAPPTVHSGPFVIIPHSHLNTRQPLLYFLTQ